MIMWSHTPLIRAAAFVVLFLLCPLAAVAENVPADCQPAEAEGWVAELAFSLKRLQLDLAGCGKDCPAELRELHGLGRVDGFVIDEVEGDIVLFGPARRPSDSVRYTDDLAVGLRSAAMRYAEVKSNTRYFTPPGVTLNPRPQTIAALRRIANEWEPDGDAWQERYCEACREPQDLILFGMNRDSDSTAAAKMAIADYVLKSMTNFDLPVAIPGFQSLVAMRRETALAELRSGKVTISSSMTRLWFTPGRISYQERPGGIAVNRADVVIRQEPQVVMKDGRHRDGGHVEPDVAKWTCQASRRYREIAAAVPDSGWDQLARLMRVFSVAWLIIDRGAASESGLDLSYLLDRHVLAHVAVKREWEGVAHVERVEQRIENGSMVRTLIVEMPSCGGVEFNVGPNLMSVPDSDERVKFAIRHVIDSRPMPDAPVWRVR